MQVADKDFFDGQCEDILYNITKFLKTRRWLTILMLDVDGRKHYLLQGKGMDCYGFDPAPEAIEYGQKKALMLSMRVLIVWMFLV